MPKIVVYDKATWHYEGDFPKDLPLKQAFVHIGLFLTWLVMRDLTSATFNEDFAAEIAQLRRRKLTGPRLLKVADGVFASDMLNTMGNAFTRAYYYAKRGKYLEDYDDLLGADCPSLYHVRDTWANFDALRTRVDERFRSWLSKHAKGPSHERLSVLRKK